MQQDTLRFHHDPEAQPESDDETDPGTENQGPSSVHFAELDALLGESDQYFDPMAKLCAQLFRWQHHIDRIQHGAHAPQNSMNQTRSLYQRAHDQATLNRADYVRRVKGLTTRPTLHWSFRLDRQSEVALMAAVHMQINATKQQLRKLL